jgi:hypothetical protein
MLFGQNPASTVILATLGNPEVGRFRDAWVEKAEDGTVRIAVYTRNGGGNRECWCDATYGANHDSDRKAIVERTVSKKWAEDNGYPIVRDSHTNQNGDWVVAQVETAICETPGSEACGCVGCLIQYRLPKHPLYLSDQDDEFDCTYATVYFRLPDEYAAGLTAMALNEPLDPDERWMAMLDALNVVIPEGAA